MQRTWSAAAQVQRTRGAARGLLRFWTTAGAFDGLDPQQAGSYSLDATCSSLGPRQGTRLDCLAYCSVVFYHFGRKGARFDILLKKEAK